MSGSAVCVCMCARMGGGRGEALAEKASPPVDAGVRRMWDARGYALREVIGRPRALRLVRSPLCDRRRKARCLPCAGEPGRGALYTLVYGRTISQHVDPVEKKPLLHFYPGSTAYSIATPGCNFRCRWCQNWEISQKVMKRLGVWVEVTTLVVPGINDDPEELRDAAQFVAQELGVETPWHISRFFPAYEMTGVPPTPVATLQMAREIGLEEGLRYVYVGNVPGEANTFCHECGCLLIRRSGYWILENHVQPDGSCPDCGTPVAGVGMAGARNPKSR